MSISTPTSERFYSCRSTLHAPYFKVPDSGLKPKFEPAVLESTKIDIQRFALLSLDEIDEDSSTLCESPSSSSLASRFSSCTNISSLDSSAIDQPRMRLRTLSGMNANTLAEFPKHLTISNLDRAEDQHDISFPAERTRLNSIARRAQATQPGVDEMMALTKLAKAQAKAQAKTPSMLKSLALSVVTMAVVVSAASMLGAPPLVILAFFSFAMASLMQEIRDNRLRSQILYKA